MVIWKLEEEIRLGLEENLHLNLERRRREELKLVGLEDTIERRLERENGRRVGDEDLIGIVAWNEGQSSKLSLCSPSLHLEFDRRTLILNLNVVVFCLDRTKALKVQLIALGCCSSVWRCVSSLSF